MQNVPQKPDTAKIALIEKYRPIGIPALKAASNLCRTGERKSPCTNAGLEKFSSVA